MKDVEDVRQEKRKLEQDIAAEVRRLVERFRDGCGLSPSSVSIIMVETTSLSSEGPSYEVVGASVVVEL